MGKKLLFVILLMGLTGYAETLTVCEALANLTELNGRTVNIRGIWSVGDAHRALMAESPCEQPTVRDGWLWPDRINLVADNGQIYRYAAEFRILLKSTPRHSPVVTLTGRFETKKHFEIKKFPNGSQLPQAFENLVAQLRFWKTSDFLAVPWRTYRPDDGTVIERPKRVE
jgi:hypothetical protein